jgi:hypothetical protein
MPSLAGKLPQKPWLCADLPTLWEPALLAICRVVGHAIACRQAPTKTKNLLEKPSLFWPQGVAHLPVQGLNVYP